MKFNLFLSMGKKTTIVDFHALPYVSKVALQMNPPAAHDGGPWLPSSER